MFSELCKLFERISSTKSRPEKLKQWKHFYSSLSSTTDIFQIIRLVIPKLDKHRSSYNLKEATITRKYIDALCISRDSNEAKRLQNYKVVRRTKDLPEALESILKNRCQGTEDYSLDKINSLLDSVQSGATSHNDKVNSLIEQMVRDLPPLQQKWLCRIILKDLHLGMSDLAFLTALDERAEAAFSICSDLKKICENLGNLSSLCKSIVLGQVFKPMLADRVTDINRIESLLKHKEFLVETKYDGERMQIHKNGDRYSYFSRGTIEYSHVYGDDPLIGSLTPFIHKHILADTCILDGEIMVFDLQERVHVTKAQGKDARKMTDTSRFIPSFIAYDIVYLNSEVLTLLPLSERRERLERVVRSTPGYLSLSLCTPCTTQAAVLDLLNEAIDRGEEGLVVKSPTSIYTPDQRIDGGWFKIKTDYLGLMNDTVDVVVLGGYYGNNRSSGQIRNFLCGLKSDSGTYSTFCKVSSGLTKLDLEQKLSKLEPFWRKFDRSSPPGCIIFGAAGREKPDVIVDPQHSLVLEVRGAELMNSSYFALPQTLRFPRVVCVRDKLPADCTNVSELEKMQSQNKRGVSRVGAFNISPRKKPRVTANKPGSLRDTRVEVKSDKLAKQRFCVLSGSEKVSKEAGERFVREHSGEIVCTPIPGCTVLCGRQSVSVQNIIKQGKHLVQDLAWVEYCSERVRPCPPRLILHCPEEMKEAVMGEFDEYGDSYTEPVTVEELREITNAMSSPKRDEGDDVSVFKRYPEFADYWRFALSDMILWTPERSALTATAELYGAKTISDKNCSSITHRLEGEEEGFGERISRKELLQMLQPHISAKLFERFSGRVDGCENL